MNNSPAYNNVLLKPSAPTAQAAVSKRNYQDDQPAASFQQSFKDVHESVRAQDEKIAKPAAKKTAAVDNRKPSNEVEKKPAAPVKQADENRPDDKVAETETSKDSNEQLANQNSNDKPSSDRETENKSSVKKSSTDEDINTCDPVADVTNPSMLVQQPLAPVADVATEVAAPVIATETTSVEPTTNLVSDALPNPENADTTVVTPGISETETPKLTTENKPDISNTNAAPIVNQQVPVEPPVAAIPEATPDVIPEQASIVLAAGGQAIQPKSAVSQPALASATDAADADVTNLATTLATENPATKVVTAATSGAAVIADADPLPAQALDTKSTFEKAFQNMILPESTKRDESATLSAATTPSNPTTASSTNALDSMLRFSEAQAPASRGFVVQTAVPVPVGQPQWSQAVGEKVLWLAAQNVSSAEIHLNPENLGPMQVKVSVNQEQTTVNFTSHHPVVREVLDQNLGRLRDMFSEQGLNLVNVDVSDKSFSRQQGEGKEQKGQGGNNKVSVEEETPVAMSVITQQRLVDHYA